MSLTKLTDRQFIQEVENEGLNPYDLFDTRSANIALKTELLKKRGYSNIYVKKDYDERNKELEKLLRKEHKKNLSEEEHEEISERIAIMLDSCTPNYLHLLMRETKQGKYKEGALGGYAECAGPPKVALGLATPTQINNFFRNEYYRAEKSA